MQISLKNEIYPQLGLNQELPQPPNSATSITNFQYNDQFKTWHNRIGFEKYFTNRSIQAVFGSAGSVDSVYNWSTHGGARTWLYFEYNGKLYYVNGSKGFTGDPKEVVINNRSKSLHQTHYNPFGDYLVICNGKDNPLMIKNGDKLYRLGLPVPSTPNPLNPRLIDNDTSDPDFTNSWGLSGADFFASEELLDSFASYTRRSLRINFDNFQGLGSEFAGLAPADGLAQEDPATYQWRCSFVFEDGSESALSEASKQIKWKLKEQLIGTANTGTIRPCIALSDIPTGPKGTVARRIYRTQTLGSEFYFVATIPNNTQRTYVDYHSDEMLGAFAPTSDTHYLFPANTARFSATYNGRLFLDGGPGQDRIIYYSEPGTINQYGANNFFDMGTFGGGSITGMISYYNQLLVFKENGIDIILSDSAGILQARPFVQGIGCQSVHSIVSVPNLGVFFINKAGIYLISGGYDADTLKLTKVSEGISGLFEQVSENALRFARCAYSHKYREVHFYLSTDGSATLDTGLVFHIETSSWSIRNGFPVKCITSNNDGMLVFGSNFEGVAAEGDDINRGLFVISNKRNAGYQISADTEVAKGPLTSEFRSSWHDFGYGPTKKFIKYIYMYAMTQGDDKISLNYYRDRDWYEEAITAGSQSTEGEKQQRGDHPDQPVYGTAIWGTDKWQDTLFTEIRYDVSIKGASQFAFAFETTNRIEFAGYSIEYVVADTKTIKGKV